MKDADQDSDDDKKKENKSASKKKSSSSKASASKLDKMNGPEYSETTMKLANAKPYPLIKLDENTKRWKKSNDPIQNYEVAKIDAELAVNGARCGGCGSESEDQPNIMTEMDRDGDELLGQRNIEACEQAEECDNL